MKRKSLITLLIVLLSGLLLVQIAVAMASTNYRLDWSTALTGGGGSASSTHYAINFTVGQSVIGASTSTSYKAGLGYWHGAAGGYRIYLPLIMK